MALHDNPVADGLFLLGRLHAAAPDGHWSELRVWGNPDTKTFYYGIDSGCPCCSVPFEDHYHYDEQDTSLTECSYGADLPMVVKSFPLPAEERFNFLMKVLADMERMERGEPSSFEIPA